MSHVFKTTEPAKIAGGSEASDISSLTTCVISDVSLMNSLRLLLCCSVKLTACSFNCNKKHDACLIC